MHKVIYAQSWRDASVNAISDDAMLPIAKGVYFHHRLQTLIVIKDEILPAIAANLP